MIPLLWRRAALVRLALGVVSLALAGGAVLGTQLAAGALHRQAAAAVRERAGSAEYDIQPFASTGFTERQAATIAALPAVSRASAQEQKPDLARLPSGSFRQVVLIVAGRDGVALRPLPLVSGSRPRSRGQIAISQNLLPGISLASGAQTPGRVRLGQRLELVKSAGVGSFRVVGVVSDSGPGAPFTEDAVYITPAAATKLFGKGLQVTDVAVRLKPGASLDQLLHQLSGSVHTEYTVSSPRSLPEGDPVAQLQPVIDGITALSLVLALAVIGATFSSVVLDRRREIGLVRLAGASQGLVFRSFLREAVAAAALGAALGVGVGYLVAVALVAISSPVGASPAPRVEPDLTWTVASFLLVLLVGVAAAALPAFQAARVPPLDAVRPPSATAASWWRLELVLMVLGGLGAYLFFRDGGSLAVGLGAACAYIAVAAALAQVGATLVRGLGSVVGPLLGAPAAAVAARARTRPGRSALALASLFVSIATATGLVGLSAATLDAGQVWVDHLFVGQYLVVSPVAQTQRVEAQLLAQIRAQRPRATVVAAAPVRFLDGRIGHLAVALAATSAGAYADSGALQFVQGERDRALAQVRSGTGVLLPLELADSLGKGVGAELRVVTATGSASFRVAGVVAHTLPGPTGQETVLVERSAAEKHFGSAASGFNLVQLQLRGEGDLQRPVALAAFRYGMEEETVSSVRQGVDTAVEHDIATLSALALVGVVIAILAAVNTVVLGAREGVRDMALLRVVGLSRGAVRRTVIAEALATALVGCALGIACGIGLIAPEVHAASSAALPLSLTVPVPVILTLAAAVVVGILVAALAPARQLSGLDPIAALSVE